MELCSTGMIFDDISKLLLYGLSFTEDIIIYDDYQFITFEDYAINNCVIIECYYHDTEKKIYWPGIAYYMECSTIRIYEDSELLLPKNHIYFDDHMQLIRAKSDHYIRIEAYDPSIFMPLLACFRSMRCSITFGDNEMSLCINNIIDSTKIAKLCLALNEKIKKLIVPENVKL